MSAAQAFIYLGEFAVGILAGVIFNLRGALAYVAGVCLFWAVFLGFNGTDISDGALAIGTVGMLTFALGCGFLVTRLTTDESTWVE